MGSLDSKIFSYAGLASALLFIVAGIVSLVGGMGATAHYVAAAAGILAIVYSIDSLTSKGIFARKVSGLMSAVAGIVAVASAFSGDAVGTVVAVFGIIMAVSMLFDALDSWVAKVKGLMTVSGLFMVIEAAVSVAGIVSGGSVLQGAVFIVAGLWIAAVVAFGMVLSGPTPKEDVPEPEPAPKEKPKTPVKPVQMPEPRKEAKPVRQEKVEPKIQSPVKEVQKPKAPVKPVEKVPEVPKEVPKKVEPAPAPKAEPKAEPGPEPKSASKNVSADFMGKLVASKNVHRTVPPKAEPKESIGPVDRVATPEKSEEQPVPQEQVEPKDCEEVVDTVPEVVEGGVGDDVEATEDVHAEEVAGEQAEVVEEVDEVPVVEVTSEAPEAEPHTDAQDGTDGEVSPASEEIQGQTESVSGEVVAVPDQEDVQEQTVEPEQDAPEQVKDDVPDDVSVPAEVPDGPEADPVPDTDDGELGEDIFTDNSPEALVRRAAWNKGLRCRRGYGDHNIPVAFVKGKVAVYVQGPGADTSVDQVLADEGWTVLRYDESSITDGKEQGEEIAQAVKANLRAAKASSKKKKKPAKK